MSQTVQVQIVAQAAHGMNLRAAHGMILRASHGMIVLPPAQVVPRVFLPFHLLQVLLGGVVMWVRTGDHLILHGMQREKAVGRELVLFHRGVVTARKCKHTIPVLVKEGEPGRAATIEEAKLKVKAWLVACVQYNRKHLRAWAENCLVLERSSA